MKDQHISDQLPAYVNGTMDVDEEQYVSRHLETCKACRSDLASWEVVREATVADSETLPATPTHDVMMEVKARIARDKRNFAPRPPGAVLSLSWQLLVGQLPLVRRGIWAASALTIAFGFGVALLTANATSAGLTLAVFAPIVAAVGIAFVYGQENDPSLEIALSTPTSPRLVLLARLTLVYCYDLALALVATVVLAFIKDGSSTVVDLISLWFAPMLFLSALALLLSLVFGPTSASLTALGLWAAKLLAASESRYLLSTDSLHLLDAFWRANPVLLPLAVALFAVAMLLTPRIERLPG